MDQADVMIYLYDSSDANSFSYVANIRVSRTLNYILSYLSDNVVDLSQEQYSLDHIPSVFVATKADLDLTQQVSSVLLSDWLVSDRF